MNDFSLEGTDDRLPFADTAIYEFSHAYYILM